MAPVFRLYVGIVTALALCRCYCAAQGNATESVKPTAADCHHHGAGDNCTDSGWNGHFSDCPEHLRHYCIHGKCRYITEQKTESCLCDFGFEGPRCEFLIIPEPFIAKKKLIIIICAIAGLVLLVVFVVFICLCPRRKCKMCWQRGRRREEPRNGTEKLSMMNAAAAAAAAAEPHTALKSQDSREPLPPPPSHTNSV
ncbi:unnamed protein product [Ophioblennius macclurei]